MTALGRVLVVDDDPQMRRVVSRVLASEGWTIVVAEHGAAGVEAVRAQVVDQFDCVVSDVNMPEMDGFELIQRVRQHDEELPVLLMTGDPSLDGAVRAIDSGAVSYLTKPFDGDQLASAVARAARRHGVQRMRRRADSFQHGETAALGAQLDAALARSWMAFQPIVLWPQRKTFAYEALVRTDAEELKRPDLMIAAAERLDRVHELGRTVRSHVARAAPSLPDDVLIFVNVHGLELTDPQLFDPRAELASIADRVVLEITERTGVDPDAGPANVAKLRALGYRIAVDDLGAGYAALGALATLEPEVVKLDMSLVRDIQARATKRRVVGAIATLCRELGSLVVAEGVETVAERDVLADLGIELFQGYLFAKPARQPGTPTF
ncbi:MAG TPA: EAL domain-containing protein [Kofleriaceae bacterium]